MTAGPTCEQCGRPIELRSPHPGRYRVTCRNCGHVGTAVVTAGPRETPAPATFHRVAKFRRISAFKVVYQRLESLADHVPSERWPLLGVYAFLILLAEVVVVAIDAQQGLLIHALVLLLLLAHAGALSLHSERLSRFVTTLALVPLARIISLAIPLGTFGYFQWILIGGAILLVAGLATARTLRVSGASLGLEAPRLRSVPLVLGLVAVGAGVGVLEYMLLEPGPLIQVDDPVALVGPALLLVVLTGVPEELLFRGLMLRHAEPLYGKVGAILLPATAQALLAFAFLDVAYMFLVFATGALFGLAAHRSKNLVGVSLAHGVANAVLFLVLPITGLPWA